MLRLPKSTGVFHERGRHDSRQYRRSLDRAIGHIRAARSGKVQEPGAKDRLHQGVDTWEVSPDEKEEHVVSKLAFPVFDADNHLYETEDAFTRYLPAEYEGRIKYVEVNGRTKIAIDNVISDYIPNPTFEVVAKPGAFADYFGGNNPEGKSLRELTGEPMRAVDAFRRAEPRLDMLDDLGLDAALMFPTLASLLEVRLTDDPEFTCTDRKSTRLNSSHRCISYAVFC